MKIRRKFQSNEHEILHLVKGHFRKDPSVSTIYRTFKRYPLNKKRKEAIKRYEKRYPGEMLHADTYSLSKTLLINRQKYYLLGALDDCTRLCFVEITDRNTAANATQAFARACKWFHAHGIIAEEVLTDNGAEFTSYTSQHAKDTHFFETMVNILGVKHRYTKPYRPQTNGKIERFWQILYKECILPQTKTLTKEELSTEIESYMYRYNYQRRHSGLNYITPLEKLKKIAEVLHKL